MHLPSEYHGERHEHWDNLKAHWKEWRREHEEHEMREHESDK
jgi:hypothetical protein